MRLDLALASISSQQWSRDTGEFESQFLERVVAGWHYGAEGIDDAFRMIDAEGNRIKAQVEADREAWRIPDLTCLPRALYLEALYLMTATVELVGADFESGEAPPKPKGLDAEDDCRQLLEWAQRTHLAALVYRAQHAAD